MKPWRNATTSGQPIRIPYRFSSVLTNAPGASRLSGLSVFGQA
jgi:hypothetical protein